MEELIRKWDNEVLERGCDSSIGPKVPRALQKAGFREIRAKAFPLVALAHEDSHFNAVCDNLRQFLLGESPENPSDALANDLKIKAREEFASQPEGGMVMDFLFVSWGQK